MNRWYIKGKFTKCKQGGGKVDSKKIGKRLVELRADKSQDEVAEAVGISRSALSMYECGERIPRDEIKIKLANYYRTSVESLFYAC